MGTTFVGMGNPRHGFWVSDSLLELWLRFLVLHVEDPTESGHPTTRIRDQWLLASRGIFMGCVPEGVEEAVSTPEGEALVRAAIGSLLQALNTAPPVLNKDVLNLMGIVGGFTADVETWRLVEVGRAYLSLLDGKITTDASDTSFMPGCGDHPFVGPGGRQAPTTPDR